MNKTLLAAVCAGVILCGLLFAGSALAAEGLTVDIFGPGQRRVNLTILPPRPLNNSPLPEQAQAFAELVRKNLFMLPFLNLVPVGEILGGDPSRGVQAQDIDLKPLQLSRVDLVMTAGWEGQELQARVFETFGGRRLVGKGYSGVDQQSLPKVADRFCSLLIEALTGLKGFFQSPLAFSRKLNGAKEIYTVMPNGRDLSRVTNLGKYNIQPAWSKDGNYLAFTHLGDFGHQLGVWERKTRRIVLKRFSAGTVISPAFAPDGQIAVTLDIGGNPDIYLLDKDYKPTGRPAPHWAIDVSPSFDAAGKFMAFVSDRAGTPQVYLLDRASNEIKRVTFEGNYNTGANLSPDGRFVVFARQMPGGHKIFVRELATGVERQITFGPGSDEDPCFGPEGYFVAFCSTRGGGHNIYVTTRNGDDPFLVPTGEGEAFAPAWDTSRHESD
jgi:TolB protein